MLILADIILIAARCGGIEGFTLAAAEAATGLDRLTIRHREAKAFRVARACRPEASREVVGAHLRGVLLGAHTA